MIEPFDVLPDLHRRPEPFSRYTTLEMWNDDHISRGMLEAHLNEASNSASRNKAFLQRSVAWTKSYFNISPSMRIVDFGCGPGLYTREWARAGADVTGIDISRRSIAYAIALARQNQLSVNYVNDDYPKYRPPGTYDLITMIFCDYCALNPTQRQRLLQKWKSILKVNGRILFDINTFTYFNTVSESRSYTYEPHGGFWAAESYREYTNTFGYEAEKLLLDQITVVESDRIRTFYNWLQCFSLETLTAELRRKGFVVLENFSNVAGDPYREESPEMAVIIARRDAT